MKSEILRKIVIGTFLSVPAISSIISTIHLIDLFNLGNPTWLSILLAVTFELGSIASLLAISVIDRIKTGAIWFIFFILSALQIIGNVYYSYSFTSEQLLANQTFLTNFMDLFSFITGDDIRDVKIFLASIIGIPIPLIALFFLKSNIDYLKPSKKIETGEGNNISTIDNVAADKTLSSNNEEPKIEVEPIESRKIELDEPDIQVTTTSDIGPIIQEEISETEPFIEDQPIQEVINEEIDNDLDVNTDTKTISDTPIISDKSKRGPRQVLYRV